MAISPDIESGPFIGNSAQTAFPFGFTAITPAEVAVELDGVAQSAGFTVTLANTGGTVTFMTAPAAGVQVMLRSNPDYLQDSVFENEGAYNLGTVNTINRRQAVRALVTKKRLDATSVAAADASAASAAASATAAAAAAGVAGGSASVASASAGGASASAAAAGNAANAATLAAATTGVYPNAAASNVPRGVAQAGVGAITGGSGGANGTFALAWSGGNFAINPTGTFTVSGGALTAVTITGAGLYIGAAPTVPTPSFAASSGLSGAGVSLAAQFLVASGAGYWVQSADNSQLLRYLNNGGAATPDVSVGPVPLVASFAPFPNGTMRRALSLVTTAGGTYSATVQTALRNFEYQLRQMQLNAYFIRLGVLLGNTAAAARIPFIQRPGMGYLADTGTITAWSEGNGLVNATLDTGLTLAGAGLDVSNVVFGCYNLADPNGSGSAFVVGNQSGSWGLAPDATGDPSTTTALMFAWDYAGRIPGILSRRIIGPVAYGAITKGPMSGYRLSDGKTGVMLCAYPLVNPQFGDDRSVDPLLAVAEPGGNIEIQARSNWPIGGYWIADSMPLDAMTAFHRIFHDLQVAAGRGVSTEGY